MCESSFIRYRIILPSHLKSETKSDVLRAAAEHTNCSTVRDNVLYLSSRLPEEKVNEVISLVRKDVNVIIGMSLMLGS